MDAEIKRLLKLSQIPNYKLLDKEEKMLAEWKKNQKKVKAPKKAKRVIPEGMTEDLEMGGNGKPALIAVSEAAGEAKEPKKGKRTYRRRKSVKNVVKSSEKILNGES